MQKAKALGRVRERRRYRVRKTLKGDAQRPRLSVDRSLKHIACQVIDDLTGKTVASASSRDKSIRSSIGYGGNIAAATVIGKTIAERCLALGVKQVKFDRGEFRYHGRVAALADAAREAGLDF